MLVIECLPDDPDRRTKGVWVLITLFPPQKHRLKIESNQGKQCSRAGVSSFLVDDVGLFGTTEISFSMGLRNVNVIVISASSR